MGASVLKKMKVFLVAASFGSVPASAMVTLRLGTGQNWAPYVSTQANSNNLVGFGPDLVAGVNAQCAGQLQIDMVLTTWENCWSNNNFGSDMTGSNRLDGCMLYSHGTGARDDKAHFSIAIVKHKTAGIITGLDANGHPKVDGASNLHGKTVADVNGWAPEPETLDMVRNLCTNTKFSSGKTIHDISSSSNEEVNDKALRSVLDGNSDALYIFADHADTHQCKNNNNNVARAHDCNLWDKLGEPNGFAYVQTGMDGWAVNGTTLMMTRKGEHGDVMELLDSCLDKYMQTQDYCNKCSKHGIMDDCFANSHCPRSSAKSIYDRPTSQQGDCSSGYCGCPEGSINTGAAVGQHMVAFLSVMSLVVGLRV